MKRRRSKPLHAKSNTAAAYGVNLPTAPSEPSLSPNQVGDILGVTGEAVKQWIYTRRLPAVKLSNGYWRVTTKDLEDFYTRRTTTPKQKLLVVGTSSQYMDHIANDLMPLKCDLVVAATHIDALLKCQHVHPNLLIVDISDFENGWLFLKSVRQKNLSSPIPALLISNQELTANQVESALQLGIRGFLLRPFKPELLLSQIRGILNISS
jgi:CheY-like chemotaxis protein